MTTTLADGRKRNDYDEWEFDDDFEESLIALLLRNKEFRTKYGCHMKVEHFSSQRARDFFTIAMEYIDKYGKEIDKSILKNEIREHYGSFKHRDESLEDYLASADRMFDVNIETVSKYAADKVIGFARRRQLKIYLREIAQNVMGKDEDLEKLRDKVGEALDIGKSQDDDDCKGLFEILEEPDEEPDYLVKPILMTRDKGYLVAPYKVGKTLSAIQLTLCLSKGVDFLNFEIPKPRKVLYVRFELSDFKFKKNLRMMMRGLSPMIPVDKEPILKLKRGFNILDQKNFDWLIKQIEKYEADLLILDPLYKLSNLDLSKPEASIPLIRAFEKIRMRYEELCILTLHHPIKQTGRGKKSTSWDIAYGPMQFFADMDFEMRLHEIEPQKTFRWDYISNSDPVSPITLSRDPDTLIYYVSDEDSPSRSLGNEELKNEMREIIQRYFQEHGGYINQTKFQSLALKELKLTQRKFRELEEQGKDVFWKTCPGEKNAILYEPI